MSHFSISIDLDHAAFEGEDCGPEVARILEDAARKIKHTSRDDLEAHAPPLFDVNGNRVGFTSFDIDAEEDPKVQQALDRQKEIEDFVSKMTRVDVVTTLQSACDIECYSHETTRMLQYTLAECIFNGTTSIETIKDVFEVRY